MSDINGAGLQPVAFHARGWGGANDNYPNTLFLMRVTVVEIARHRYVTEKEDNEKNQFL
jgi:hypothetical protein